MFPSASAPLIHEKHRIGFAGLLVLVLAMTVAAAADGVAATGKGGAPKYALTLSASESAVNAVAVPIMTATVTVDGAAAPGQNVVFTWRTKGDPQPPQPGQTSATNANGQTAYKLKNIGGSARTLTVTAALEKNPSITATADVRFELPDGFLALAELAMSPGAAQNFCRSHGGKLPRVNDSDSLPRTDGDKITRIDGFGAPGAPWPFGLPYDRYWTGTDFTGEAAVPGKHGGKWLIGVKSGGVVVHDEGKSVTYRVVCVP